MKNKGTPKTGSDIDWETLHRKMDEADQKLKDSENASPAALEQAWARRSAKLAQQLQQDEEGETLPVAVVNLDGELYGLDARHIFDIRILEHVTFVPRTPAWVLGVVNWRGRILSVIDLRRFWGLSPTGTVADRKSVQTRLLVVVQSGEMEVGLQADEVFPVLSIPLSKISKDDGNVRGISPALVQGIFVRANQETVVLLDLPAMLADPLLVVREEI